MSHMKPKHCLKPNRKRQSNHELSDDAIEAAIKRVDEWEGQTRDLLLSMFDSQMIERCDGAVPFIPFKSNTQPDRGTGCMVEDVLLLQLQARRIHVPLSQTVKRRKRLSNDQIEVWREVAKQE